MPTHEPNAPVLYSFEDAQELVKSLADFILKAQNEAIGKKDKFSIAISGGSLPKQLAGLIDRPDAKWSKWSVYFVLCKLVVINADMF